MHPECRGILSIVEKLIQYYPISPGPVARPSGCVLVPSTCHGSTEPAIVARDGAEAPAISRSHHPQVGPQ